MSSQPLDVEISVVNTNNRDLLERCLASLPAACEALTAGSDDLRWHVTVIDNASTDGSAAMVAERFPDATVRRNEDRRGFGTNHNQVLRAVVDQQLARYALVLNEDTEVSPGSITALVRRCDTNPGVGAAGPTLVGGDGLPQRTYRPLPRPVRDLLDPLGITRERS
ncbi:MAG: glycosyltransferase, partial [Gaiellaceae bacterium]